MTIERVDLMRRFITFIDVMYEHKVKLLACAPTSPATLFEAAGSKGVSDEEFAWDRAASRLAEMSTQEYVEAPWRPKSGAWLLEQARVTEVVPPDVLRGLWQRYDADHNGAIAGAELDAVITWAWKAMRPMGSVAPLSESMRLMLRRELLGFVCTIHPLIACTIHPSRACG